MLRPTVPLSKVQVVMVTPLRAAVGAAIVIAAIISCGDSLPGATDDGTAGVPPGGACATPETGCPCTPGTSVPCGKEVRKDNDFIYCYQGTRVCGPDGKYGECEEGAIVPKSLSSLRIQTLGAAEACSGSDSGPLKVCTQGKKQGEFCTTHADCAPGVKLCNSGPNAGAPCKKEKDCAEPGSCVSYNGRCNGGVRHGLGCDGLADCPGGTACTPEGFVGSCATWSGICDDGANMGEACNVNADCPGSFCDFGKHGRCRGGKENGKKCKRNKHCYGNVACSAEVDAGLDPCDPYCHVFTDTPFGVDAGGFASVDGGITPLPSGSVCGDGVVSGAESCDDGNTTSGDGCSSICRIETGYQCPTPGSPCIAATCGNGVIEGAEQCDDGNLRPYDGCSPSCQRDFNCPVGSPCVAVCGDGFKFPSEACDDGNNRDGDGCSSTCTIEPGSTCTTVTAPLPDYIDVPVIYRDFIGRPTAGAHPDFQPSSCAFGVFQGIPRIDLAADKEPEFNSPVGCTSSATNFNQWYRDTPGVNRVILGRYIRLTKTGPSSTTYVFNSSADPAPNAPNINCATNVNPMRRCQDNGYGGFFPINALGWGNYSTTGRNYHFTSEVRYAFTYGGGEVLSFTGDDDVFVYVAGKKVLDIGGVHGAASASVTLSNTMNTVPPSSTFNLVPGQTYEIAVFQAERNTTESNYRLTLSGFNRVTSLCTPPPSPRIFVRDYQAVCPPATRVQWQLFRWQAGVPAGASIDFRAATADTQSALPAAPPPAAPTTVPIGQANSTNSPIAGPVTWRYETAPPGATPVPVSERLATDGAGQSSKEWLRVYMIFNGPAILYQWQQLYDCVPAE